MDKLRAMTSFVRIAGVYLVFSYLIVPAVCGALLSARTATRLAIGWVVALTAGMTGLLSWYFAWGGGIGASWSWRIGSSHNHGGYQNPVAAWALSTAGPTGTAPRWPPPIRRLSVRGVARRSLCRAIRRPHLQ